MKRRKRVTKGPKTKSAKERTFSPIPAQIADYYRPLKKPVTIRIDADVLAWFKKDGRRYQSRINAALRKMMERGMKNS
jgi:uncharacterized protein (DUF4415 family)